MINNTNWVEKGSLLYFLEYQCKISVISCSNWVCALGRRVLTMNSLRTDNQTFHFFFNLSVWPALVLCQWNCSTGLWSPTLRLLAYKSHFSRQTPTQAHLCVYRHKHAQIHCFLQQNSRHKESCEIWTLRGGWEWAPFHTNYEIIQHTVSVQEIYCKQGNPRTCHTGSATCFYTPTD